MTRPWVTAALAIGIWLALNVSAFWLHWNASEMDKLLHVGAFFAISFFASRAALTGADTAARPYFAFAVFAACVAVGAADEWVQGGSPYRVSDATDLAADAVGALLGVGVAWRLAARSVARS